jgi:hypothetical protein
LLQLADLLEGQPPGVPDPALGIPLDFRHKTVLTLRANGTDTDATDRALPHRGGHWLSLFVLFSSHVAVRQVGNSRFACDLIRFG